MPLSKREWVLEKDLVLLVRAGPDLPSGLPELEVLGQRLCRVGASQLPGGLVKWPYTCVSYASGDETAEHPFEPGQRISARAMPSLSAVLREGNVQALWVDFACLPQDGPGRAPLLQQLGRIYADASAVMVVLTQSSARALEQSARVGALDPAALEELERDDWVTRAWTYQEIANSRKLAFVCAQLPGVVVGAEVLLNHLGKALSDFRAVQSLDIFETRFRFPRLDGLEDVLADCMIGVSLERCAYQVLSSMYRRVSHLPEQFFEAMLGAIAAAPELVDASTDFRALFFTLCDAKGDFSYIYAVGSDKPGPGPTWRPALGPLQAVLPWHSHGPGQAGSLHDAHLMLEGMFLPGLGPIASAADEFVRSWAKYQRAPAAPRLQTLPERVYRCLQLAGFTGPGSFIECEAGYFFPQAAPPDGVQLCVAVATGVRWVQGAPGLLTLREASGRHRFWCAGAFIGKVPAAGEGLELAHARAAVDGAIDLLRRPRHR